MIRAAHHFLSRHAFYPLALSSVLAVAALAARIVRAESTMFFFLSWNLFLAWMPYWASLWADATVRRAPGAWWRLILPGVVWLLFFPNAPYLITDFIHYKQRHGIPWWYDVGMLGMFALTGLLLAVVSLQTMAALVQRFAGRAVSWLFVLCSVGLCGLGIYIGRVLRWNSWDVLTDPTLIMRDLATLLLRPHHNPAAIGFSAMFATLLLMCYLVFVSAARRER